ncbi:MAG: hypothetical protein HQK76_13035 [Desulfobacterales bacterium]|nr:hypothetical protein [Desulfobacterales bacterium]
MFNKLYNQFDDLSGLNQKYDLAIQKQEDLSKEFISINDEIKVKQERLTKLRRKYAVIEKQKKDAQKKIFFLKNKIVAIDENTSIFFKNFEEQETELKSLIKLSHVLSLKIKEFQKTIDETNNSIEAITKKFTDNEIEKNQLEDKAKLLSHNIELCLENTSLERDEVNEMLKGLNTLFFEKIEERMSLNDLLLSTTSGNEELRNTISVLSGRLIYIEELKGLINKRDELKLIVENKENELSIHEQNLQELQKIMSGKTNDFNLISLDNDEQTKRLATLEEEIKIYKETLAIESSSHENLKKTINLIDEGIESLKGMMLEQYGLQEALQTIRNIPENLNQITD